MPRTGWRGRTEIEANKAGPPKVSATGRDPRERVGEPELLESSDRELVEALRRDSEPALREFFRRFRPVLLREARMLLVQSAIRAEMVDECLDDVAMRLRLHTTAPPRNLTPYLIRALRLQRLMARRTERRRKPTNPDEHSADDYRPADLEGPTARSDRFDSSTRVDEAALSEGTRHASEGVDFERPPASPALLRLAATLAEGLDEEERLLFIWLGNWIPQSQIAQWLGISHGAARVRVARLRERLKAAVLRVVSTCTDEDYRQLVAFFRRISIAIRPPSGVPEGDPTTAPRPPDASHRTHDESATPPGETTKRTSPLSAAAGSFNATRSENSTSSQDAR
jgi:RNA polymerase sigma factor (sigma-70 family)